jgi:HTH-type transcriptional regulator / antitoxin HigA
MNTFKVHAIRTEAEYRDAMARINELAARDPAFGTAEYDELEVWSYIVRHFEDEHYPLEFPALKDVIDFRADQMGLGPSDLDSLFGGSGRRSEVLSGVRALSKGIANRLKEIGVPDAVLLQLLLGGRMTNRVAESSDRVGMNRPVMREKGSEYTATPTKGRRSTPNRGRVKASGRKASKGK